MGPGSTPPPRSSDSGEEHWSIVSVAFGAVVGTIVSILIEPLVRLLHGKLFEEFLTGLVETTLSLGFPVLFSLIAVRIRRLDRFLRRYLPMAALLASTSLAGSMWARAGASLRLLPLVAAVLTAAETWGFLLFCGGAIQTGLSQIVGTQKAEYERQRDADAQRVAAEAIAEGDPAIAIGIFGRDVGAAVGQAIAAGCLGVAQVLFHMIAIWLVSTLDAHVFFDVPPVWSALAGIIVAAATTQLVTISEELGERRAETVPLEEKYDGILPDRSSQEKDV